MGREQLFSLVKEKQPKAYAALGKILTFTGKSCPGERWNFCQWSYSRIAYTPIYRGWLGNNKIRPATMHSGIVADRQEAMLVQLILCSGERWQLIITKNGNEKPHSECSIGLATLTPLLQGLVF